MPAMCSTVMVLGTRVLNKNLPGVNNLFVLFIYRTSIGVRKSLAILNAPLLSRPMVPFRLRVPSGNINKLPPDARNSSMVSRRSIINSDSLSSEVEGRNPDCCSSQPKMGTLKKVLFTMVLCRGNNEINSSGSRYD